MPCLNFTQPRTSPLSFEIRIEIRLKGRPSTLVEIPALAHPDWMIEIEAIAVL
jgi:hypothetical protein